MDSRATESEIQESENKPRYPTVEPISLPLGFVKSITREFCNEQELGRGGYGTVYKGHLQCGLIVAVKKIHNIHLVEDDISLFQREVTPLMGIKHQNVVQLLGYCAESSWEMVKLSNGNYVPAQIPNRILCFEYLCNKSLDKYLSDKFSGLEWNMTFKIIKGICSGLDFLHACDIIHLDLKPPNILMDYAMVPKIADFGLSRILGEQKNQTVTKNPAGSIGYMSPEYMSDGIITKKADIFSLGVIIIEILTGQRDSLYPQSNDSQHLIENVLNNWRNRFESASKYTTLELTALELLTQQVKQCINVALECVHANKDKRPNAFDIIKKLNAAETSCYVPNGEDLLVNHQMETHEFRKKRKKMENHDVQCEDRLVALNRSVTKYYELARTSRDTRNLPESVTPLQLNVGSVAARNASFWVAHKALASLEGNLLKDWAAKINLGPNVKALQLELMSTKVILGSTLGKVIQNSALESYLMMLHDLVYDAEDVLDEMEYFRIQDMLHGTVDADYQHAGEPSGLRFDRDDAFRRIQHIVEQILFVRQEISSATKLLAGSDWSTAPNIAQSRPVTISESIEPKLYGRELVMKRVIDDITEGKHSREVLTVIPIVGPGGIGKTALAQHIYHSGKVQQHFDVKVWTCVSLNFNVTKLTEEIERYVPKVDHESSNGTASEMIGQRLKHKRLFLVLDDIWDCSDEDEWKQLLVPFQKSQVQGNIIIVTTRFPAQAHIMVRKNDNSIYLQGLDSEPFEELFLKIIFGDDDESRKDHEFLLETGIMIAGRLKGSPLAAKTVGRLLKTHLDLDHWTRVLESREWEQSNGKNDIMHALKLSFEYLPSQLQQCFSYFALFPQDYKFEGKELINFWIGQEVLYSSHGENKRVEDIGQSCLTELVNYGFLLENKGGKDETTCYVIHDLLHDLARKVSSLECLSIDNSQSQVSSLQILPSIRHLSINIDDTSARDRLTLKNCAEDFNSLGTRLQVKKLRTLMIFGKHHCFFVKAFGDLFREAMALRLIFLSGASYDVKDLLQNFDCLVHLRYLRIHCSMYKVRFPDRISKFYHMKVLQEKHCHVINNQLLRDISNLLYLRHLLIQDDRIHSSIVDVGKLKSLQELRRFEVKQGGQGFELRQIGHLEQLCGSLHINSLENVHALEEADEAKLMLKSRLHELTLQWQNTGRRSINDSTLEDHILERLKPSRDLQKLSILGHRGGTCPSWLGMNLSLSSLKSLCLDDVSWKTFPPIGDLCLLNVPRDEISINIPDKRFRNLRRLELRNLSGLKTWAVRAPCQLFPYLEVLDIQDCPQLVELSFQHFGCCQQCNEVNVNSFPTRLLRLRIISCPQLSSFPLFPWTEVPCSINIKKTSSLDKLVCGGTYSSEYCLTIEGNKDTDNSTVWNVLAFHNLARLKMLSIERCQPLPLCYLQMLSSLRVLHMSCSRNAFPFVEADSHVKYQFPVEQLSILKWNASGKQLTQLLTYFPKLSNLSLWRLEKVTGFSVNVKGQPATKTGPSSSVNVNKVERQQDLLLLPPQLQELQIEYCPKLSLLCSNPHDDSNQDGRARGGGIQGLTSLRWLIIKNCSNLLSSYSSSSFPFPNSLQHLKIRGAVGTGAAVSLSNLTALTSLDIYNCGDLRGNGLLSLLAQGNLTELSIRKAPNFFADTEPPWAVHEQDHPFRSSKLQKLVTDDVAGFTAACRSLLFSSLATLGIDGDNKVARFTEEQEALLFVNSLENVNFCLCDNLQSLPKRLHGLRYLKRLLISGCEAIHMLPKDGLPSSLQELTIHCPKIQSLPKDCLPDSLQKLMIGECPAIRSLPKVDDLPSSLRVIDVSLSRSKELKSHCRKLINIIPVVRVD